MTRKTIKNHIKSEKTGGNREKTGKAEGEKPGEIRSYLEYNLSSGFAP